MSTPKDTPSFAFGKERRLLRRSDFLRVQGSPFRVVTRSFVLLVKPRPEPDAYAKPARIGLTVGKKVGNSPERARTRRVLRECFRLWPKPGLLPPGFDLVVVARAGAAERTFDEAKDELSRVARLLVKRCEEARESLARAPAEPHVPARGNPPPEDP